MITTAQTILFWIIFSALLIGWYFENKKAMKEVHQELGIKD